MKYSFMFQDIFHMTCYKSLNTCFFIITNYYDSTFLSFPIHFIETIKYLLSCFLLFIIKYFSNKHLIPA